MRVLEFPCRLDRSHQIDKYPFSSSHSYRPKRILKEAVVRLLRPLHLFPPSISRLFLESSNSLLSYSRRLKNECPSFYQVGDSPKSVQGHTQTLWKGCVKSHPSHEKHEKQPSRVYYQRSVDAKLAQRISGGLLCKSI